MSIGKTIKFVFGLLLLSLGGLAISLWWTPFLNLIKGGIGIALVLLGLLAILLGSSE